MTTAATRAPSGRGSDGGRPRVVIIGSGFGGLFAAKALKRAPVEVTLIGKTANQVSSFRLKSVSEISAIYGPTLLKGPFSLCCDGNRTGR